MAERTVIGILAHVDAGKTTLSEAMLYCSGGIRSLGRVDHGNAFLDTFTLERQRGITIFSKQAVMTLPGGTQATLLDTPGHADFSGEMERTLDVLDCAVLVISASSGVQSHTRTVWRLLREKHIPTLLFINKMDLPDTDKEKILRELRGELGDGFADMADRESVALCDEKLLDEFLETGSLKDASVAAAVKDCRLFPCWFGTALKLRGVEEFLDGLEKYAPSTRAKENFAAKVFKISRDEQNNRLTHMKITGGSLKVRDTLRGEDWEEKVTQLRVYSGAKFRAADEALPGDVVAAVGLSRTFPGMGLGEETRSAAPELEPVLTYDVILPEGYDCHKALEQFRILEEEEPLLHVEWSEQLRRLRVNLMGEIQLEILRQLLTERFGLEVNFGQSGIIYRETIEDTVEGVGHYEPLRHYAEVHLIMEPAPRGSGINISSQCPEDELDRNWQRLILTHLAEKQHLGVLTGSPITDINITLAAGKAHPKHTEGGDFRQATYRAVRQGLMRAKSVLLEPWYEFRLELPQENVGKAMSDLQLMGAEFQPPVTDGGIAVITGSAPVSAMQNYPQKLAAYTRGLGRFSCALKGYEPCGNQDDVVREIGYNPEADTENTPDSVFCSHGSGVNVKWDEVEKHMHLPSVLEPPAEEEPMRAAARYCEMVATDKELMQIFERTYGPVKRNNPNAMRSVKKPKTSVLDKPYKAKPVIREPEYVLVDGYNIIFAWDELRKLAADNLELARNRLIEILTNYQGFRRCNVILVYDAYKVKGNTGSIERHGGLSVVYTKEAETADMYIEKVTSRLGGKHNVRVATSDGLEQIIILSHGALRVSASSFQEEVELVNKAIQDYLKSQTM